MLKATKCKMKKRKKAKTLERMVDLWESRCSLNTAFGFEIIFEMCFKSEKLM